VTIDKLKAGARNIEITIGPCANGVIDVCNIHANNTTFFRGETLRLIETSALERALRVIEIYQEALKDIKSADTHGLKNAITYSNVAHEALEAARKVLEP